MNHRLDPPIAPTEPKMRAVPSAKRSTAGESSKSAPVTTVAE